MKIERINKGSWGKVRAFFDVRTDEGFVIKGFTLVEGINGKFVGFPSKKNEQGEYFPTIWADENIKSELEQLAMRAYGQESVSDSNSDTNAEPIKTSEAVSDNATQEPAKNEEFNEDDIPF